MPTSLKLELARSCFDGNKRLFESELVTCADPESFARGDSDFLVDEGIYDPSTTINGPSFKWRFAGWPMIGQHSMLAW